MATVVQPLIEPDTDAIKAHLAILFAPCVEHYPQGLIELRHGATFQSSYFGIHARGLDDAAAFAADRTRAGNNVYVGVNPRKPDTDMKGAASAADVEVSFFHFADLDDEDAVAAAGRRLKALPPTFTITTGTTPHRRPHFYWKLEEPVGNMPAWSARQQGIAQSLDGDKVIDPPRIMRLAGTVNWPDQKKLQRGYKPELVTLRTQFEDEREPVTPEQVTAAYPVRDQLRDLPVISGETTLSAMARTKVGDLIAACLAGDKWHNNMIRLTSHLAGKGYSSDVILALADHITLPGYSVDQTPREMLTGIQSARLKYGFAEPADDVEQEEAARDSADSIFEMLDLDELENMPPIEWLVEEVIGKESLAVIFGDPEAGKTFTAIDLCLRLAHSLDWHGTEAKPCGILYVAGEGARGLGARVKGWRKRHGMEGVDAPFLLVPVAVQLLDPKEHAKLLRTLDAAAQRAGFAIGLVVIDTVSRAIAGQDENGQESMSALVAACDAVRRHIGGAVLGIHHSGKDKERGMRGSSVLLGAIDTAIKVEKITEIVSKITLEKQKDAEKIAPFFMDMEKVTWGTGLEKEQSTLVPFRSEAPPKEVKDSLNNEQIAKAFGILTDAWAAKKPLSTSANTRDQGRYAAAVLAERLGCKEGVVKTFLTSWLHNDCIEIAEIDAHTHTKGIRVLNPLGIGA